MDSTNSPGYDITCGKCLKDLDVHLETSDMERGPPLLKQLQTYGLKCQSHQLQLLFHYYITYIIHLTA